ncbi:hypothetical protein [Streptomyces sp. XY533]|uniref:hypothetical protein n=1 Tax=Streptomyces sp. XY533 TaxID=1519481 RepID=UPI0006AE6AEE|nr:hypothetical protein [Streptomyces sp. XY533]KOU99107.1 hypothetical protein ADK92_12960 [Streptomyces sp. XY533]
MPDVGSRIELTAPVTALGHTAHEGEQGTVQGTDPDGYLIVRMDDGRHSFPHRDEVQPANP